MAVEEHLILMSSQLGKSVNLLVKVVAESLVIDSLITKFIEACFHNPVNIVHPLNSSNVILLLPRC